MSAARLRKHAWVMLVLGDAAVLLYGLIILIHPNALLDLGFESHTGDSWTAFRSSAPLAGEYFSLLVRMLGGYNVAFGLVAVLIALKPFRRGEAWAWWSLALGNALAYGIPVSADLYVGSIGFFEMIELTVAPLMAVALAVTAKESLGRS